MIRRLLLGVLVAVALAACVGAGDSPATPMENGETGVTRLENASPQAAEGPDPPDDSEGESLLPPQGPVSDCAGAPSLLLVTGADGAVTLIQPGGVEVRQLRGPTAPGHPGLQPTWSPTCLDGRRLIAWTEVGDDGAMIAVADAGRGEIRRHSSPVAPFYYYWSPHAAMLAFLGQNAFSPLQMGVLDLHRETVEMVGEGQPFYFDWRRDSQAMVAHVGDAMSLFIHRDGVWSRGDIPLTPGMFQAPMWASSDGILIAAPLLPGAVEVHRRPPDAQGDLPGQRLVITDPDGASLRTLADLQGAAAFGLDPAGNRVAFTDFAGPLRVLDIEQGISVEVSDRQVAAFQWSPDGNRLLFMEVDIEAQALAPKVWDGVATLVFPSFFPTRVFLLQYLPFWDQYSRSLTLWAPGGEAFTYPAASPDGDWIMVQHLQESTPAKVADGVFASWSPASP